MKRVKKLLALVMSIALVLSALPMIYANAETRTAVETGFCGAEWLNLTWTLYSDGELVIEGTGAMARYPWGAVTAPWYKYCNSETKTPVKVITLAEGVTSIGFDAFDVKERAYTRINLPESLEFIEGYPFDWYDSHQAGAMIAVCYAGSQNEWNGIEHKNFKYKLNDDQSYSLTYTDSSYGKDYNLKADSNYIKMFFNNEEPQAVCEFAADQVTTAEYGEQLSVCAYYYAPNGEKVEWRQKGESAKVTFSNNIAYVETTEQGEIELTAVLVDKNGDIIDSDTVKINCEYNTLLVLKVIFSDLIKFFTELINALFK